MSLTWHDNLNAETPPSLLAASYYTPTDAVFVRNHGDVPELDERTHAIDIVIDPTAAMLASQQGCASLGSVQPARWSMRDVKDRVTPQKVTVAIECAGNHRSKMNEMRMTKGIPWRSGAIANLEWEGPLVRDVLLACGVPDPFSDGRTGAKWTNGLYVHFESAQKCHESDWYGSSIPLVDAMRPDLPVLLAYKQNGETLTPLHGYPLRVVVPGHIGARSVKWLSRIRILPYESDCFYMQLDYKIVVPESEVEADMIQNDQEYRKRKMLTVRPLMAMGVGGGIMVPEDGATLRRGPISCSGYAIGEQGSPITHVQVAAVAAGPSATGEAIRALAAKGSVCWIDATLRQNKGSMTAQGKDWGWTLWDAKVPLPPMQEGETIALVMRVASTSAFQQRAVPWNVRGVGMRAWSVVKGLKVC